jgi:phosphatidylglycerophosphate synthase
MELTRFQKIRNFQSQDWYPAIIVRPITILVMLVIADWKFLTPNRLTTLANIFKIAAVPLILMPQHWIAAIVMLQLGILFDHLDGTVARYRRTFTKFGSFYDKVSDIITWPPIVLAAGWMAYVRQGHAYYIMFAAGAVIALCIRGYMKWLFQAEGERLRWLEAKKDPSLIAKHTAPIIIKPPPVRTPAQWALWFAKSWLAILYFEEMDLSLGLAIDRLDLCMWLMAITQVPLMLVMAGVRLVWINRIDKQMRDVEADLANAS